MRTLVSGIMGDEQPSQGQRPLAEGRSAQVGPQDMVEMRTLQRTRGWFLEAQSRHGGAEE